MNRINHKIYVHLSRRVMEGVVLFPEWKNKRVAKFLIFCIVSIFFLPMVSCKKFLDVPPPKTQLVKESVFSSNSTAVASVTGMYSTMISNSAGGGFYGISGLLGLSADELKLFPTTITTCNEAYQNAFLNTSSIPFWNDLYNCIYQSNLAIEQLNNSSAITDSIKQQLLGESKFIRAFCYYYLVNIYGDVPIILSSYYPDNVVQSRKPMPEVYEQITLDLQDAKSLLGNSYLKPNGTIATQRVRPNKVVAMALMARVYLYMQKWDLAESEASAIINNSNYQLLTNLNSVFLADNNKESIWQLESVNNGSNAPDAVFIAGYLGSAVPSSSAPYLLSDSLVNFFEPGDKRKQNWVVSKTVGTKTYYFPSKYKLGSTGLAPQEYPVLFRLAEQYLIRAEAKAQQNKLSEAITDLNTIRTRAGLVGLSTGLTQAQVLAAVVKERRVELFTEYGHRWLDLKRTGDVNNIMSTVCPLKGGTWNSNWQLYPIPLIETQRDPNLGQNPGYQ